MKKILIALLALGSLSSFATDCTLTTHDYHSLTETFGYNPTLVSQNKNIRKKLSRLNEMLADKNILIDDSRESSVVINRDLKFVGPNYEIRVSIATPDERIERSQILRDGVIQAGEKSHRKLTKMILDGLSDLSSCR